MKLKWLPVVSFALLVLVSVTTNLEAQPRRRPAPRPFERGFELSFMPTYTDFESDLNIEEAIGFGFRFGYFFSPRHEIETFFNSVATEDEFDPFNDVDVFHFQVEYVHNFRRDGVVPYLTAGIGFINADDNFRGSETDPIWGIGGGIRLFAGPVFHFRLEYRLNRFEGDNPVFANGRKFDMDEFGFGVG